MSAQPPYFGLPPHVAAISAMMQRTDLPTTPAAAPAYDLEALVSRLVAEELDRRAAEADAAKRHLEPTMRHCLEAASAEFGISIIDIKSSRKTRPIARARQTAFWLARKVTASSLPEIGDFFERNHGTVHHGIEAAEARRAVDFDYKEQTDRLLSLFIGFE
jgi:chromosomal replication initiation ATPase DnaA